MPSIKDVERVVFKVTNPEVDDDGELHDIKTTANAKGETSFKITSLPGYALTLVVKFKGAGVGRYDFDASNQWRQIIGEDKDGELAIREEFFDEDPWT